MLYVVFLINKNGNHIDLTNNGNKINHTVQIDLIVNTRNDTGSLLVFHNVAALPFPLLAQRSPQTRPLLWFLTKEKL